MNSALGQNDHYLCYISAIWEGPLCVTAKLTEMVQYLSLRNITAYYAIWQTNVAHLATQFQT